MADISRLSRLLNGVQRQVSLSDNTLVVDNLKIKIGSGNDANHATFTGSLTAARSIAMPDANVNLGQIAINQSDISTNSADISANTSDIADIRTTQGTSDGDTDLGVFSGSTITDANSVKGALQELETSHEATDALIDGHLDGGASKHDADEIDYERLDGSKKNILAASDEVESALTDLDDAIGALAASPTNYTPSSAGIVASHLSGIDTALGSITSTINNFEWQESALDFVTDNTVAPATETTGDRYILSDSGGVPHANYDGASAGDIVEFDGTVWQAVTPTTGTFIAADDEPNVLYLWGGASWSAKAFESTTASGLLEKTGFDISLADSTAANIIVYNGSGVASSVAMSGEATISNVGAVTLDNAAVINKVLTGYTSGAGTVAATDSILEAIQKIDGNQQAHEADATDAHAATAISFDNTSAALPGAPTEVQSAIEALDTRVDDLEGGAAALTSEETPNAALGAGLRAVRWGNSSLDTPETAGQLYPADATEQTLVKAGGNQDAFWVIGLVNSDNTTDPQSVYRHGLMTVTSHGLTIGQPIYLGSNGALSSTPPSTAGEAVVKCGIVKDANTLDININLMGVN